MQVKNSILFPFDELHGREHVQNSWIQRHRTLAAFHNRIPSQEAGLHRSRAKASRETKDSIPYHGARGPDDRKRRFKRQRWNFPGITFHYGDRTIRYNHRGCVGTNRVQIGGQGIVFLRKPPDARIGPSSTPSYAHTCPSCHYRSQSSDGWGQRREQVATEAEAFQTTRRTPELPDV